MESLRDKISVADDLEPLPTLSTNQGYELNQKRKTTLAQVDDARFSYVLADCMSMSSHADSWVGLVGGSMSASFWSQALVFSRMRASLSVPHSPVHPDICDTGMTSSPSTLPQSCLGMFMVMVRINHLWTAIHSVLTRNSPAN